MPQLAEGIDLIGEYEGSGFKETPYLARRMDGQTLQLTELLYLVAEEVDGERDFEEIAGRVSEKFGRTVSADNIQFLVEEKLRPIGVLARADGSSPKLEKPDPMLALKLRAGLVPERAVQKITRIFHPLFFMPVMVVVVGAFIALDVWLFFFHGVGQSVQGLLYQPVLFLLVFGLVVLSAAFHEIGHATACRYGGARPGRMGAGIYLVYPAFFSDVTDAYRLGKFGRVRTDLGGLYFNMIFSLLIAGAYFYTGLEPLLAVILILHFEMLHQLMPFLRLDGYYIVSDVTGVPDLFPRIKPILRSFAPGKEAGPLVTALKPWVRVVVTAWVVTLVPVLLYLFFVLVMMMPRMFATAYDSFLIQYDAIAAALGAGAAAKVAAGAVQIISLALPLAGIVYTFTRLTKNVGLLAWRRSEGHPALRGGFASVALVGIGLAGFILWPNGDYKPIQPTEVGTIQASLASFKDIPTGRPSLTAERAQELDGAPTLRSQVEPSPDAGWTDTLFASPATPTQNGTASPDRDTTPGSGGEGRQSGESRQSGQPDGGDSEGREGPKGVQSGEQGEEEQEEWSPGSQNEQQIVQEQESQNVQQQQSEQEVVQDQNEQQIVQDQDSQAVQQQQQSEQQVVQEQESQNIQPPDGGQGVVSDPAQSTPMETAPTETAPVETDAP